MKGIINVALIGCGRIADVHVPGYLGASEARIFAVCDANPAVAEARGREWGAERVYVDYNKLLADEDVHAVEILTPLLLHEPMTIAAAAAGKHIALQKPMTYSLSSADRMLAACRRAGVVFKITENYVFYPPLVKAKELIEQGAIGEPLGVRIRLLSGGSGGWAVPAGAWEWRIKESEAGRGLNTFDHGHHLWSTAWFLLGESERVTAWIESNDGIMDCPAVVMWKYKSGARLGVCDLIHAGELHIPSKYYANDEWIEITGTGGVLFIRRCTGNIHDGPALGLFDGGKMHAFDVPSDWGLGFIGATRNFIDAIHARAPGMLSGEEAREVLRFSLAVQKSARARREVLLDEMDAFWPAFYALRKRAGARLRRLFTAVRLPFAAGSTARYAPLAADLTEKLLERFDAEAARNWEIDAGLKLSADGKTPEQLFSLSVKDSQARLIRGALPENPTLTLIVPAGVWAAILMKKKKIETALLQGKLKAEGRLEEGLRLRKVFRL